MKKTVLLCFAVLLLAGCGSDSAASQTQSTDSQNSLSQAVVSTAPESLDQQSKNPDEIMNDLKERSWQIQAVSSDLIPMWKDNRPEDYLAGMSGDGMIVMAGYFPSDSAAREAYDQLIVSKKSAIEESNGKNYRQMTESLDDADGFWLFRQVGSVVTGIWYAQNEQQPQAMEILNLFQASAQ